MYNKIVIKSQIRKENTNKILKKTWIKEAICLVTVSGFNTKWSNQSRWPTCTVTLITTKLFRTLLFNHFKHTTCTKNQSKLNVDDQVTLYNQLRSKPYYSWLHVTVTSDLVKLEYPKVNTSFANRTPLLN